MIRDSTAGRAVVAVAVLLLALPAWGARGTRPKARRPLWTSAAPHFETRDGRRIAVAVGSAQDANPALARAAAEERARADLLRLIQDKAPNASVQGQVKGAQPVMTYEGSRGWVYVRLELDTGPAPVNKRR